MDASYPYDINVDLHMHSTASDGLLAPDALIARAAQNGVKILSLTDHDTLAGQHVAMETARSLGLRYIPGVEVSVTWGNETVHIVGLNVDVHNKTLNETLSVIQQGRESRARKMASLLVEHGLPDLLEDAQGYARNPDLIGRTHFARAMVAKGICPHMDAVFQSYLTPGKPGFLQHQWASLTDAVTAIRAAGGVAVLAHPARYRLSTIGHWALIDEFKTLGGAAIEVVTGSHTTQETRRFQRVALDHGLQASRGSDFHGDGESRFDVGAVPALPDGTLPVWHAWAH